MNIELLYQDIEALYPKMVEIRRDFHQNPELSFQEVRTPKVIAEYLEELGLEVRTKVGGRGVVGNLRGNKKGKTVALRADFDALPINEETDVSYKSLTPGVMHACGHDGHTATLMGVATVLAKHVNELEGNVVFIFQFAEEAVPGGAKPMIADGCLDGVDVIFGTHLFSTIPFGEIHYREGYIMAGGDNFEMTVTGKGGHGAAPHETIDPIVIASQLVVNLQQIISRQINPFNKAILSVGAFNSGDTYGVIPNEAKLMGTFRFFEADVGKQIEQKMEQITKSTCEANGATSEIIYRRGYDAVYNHSEETKFIKNIASDIVEAENVIESDPLTLGEDFSYYLNEIPGTFFFTGAMVDNPEEVYPHHHPKFNFNEKAMLVAAKVFIAAVAQLNQSQVASK